MAKTALMFTHGFLGSNRQFDVIKTHLSGCGADFVDHVIDGHGGTSADFAKSSDASWQRCFDEHVCRLEEEYDEIFLVGHSMGGLLSVRAAMAHPRKIRGIVAVAFPLKVQKSGTRPGYFREVMGPKVEGEDPRVTAARELSGVKMSGTDELIKIIPNLLRFLRLERRTRDELPGLKAPLTAIFAEKDEVVSPTVPALLGKILPGARMVTMPGAFHFLFGEENQKLIADEILEMMGGF